jgi:hypothetical protein
MFTYLCTDTVHDKKIFGLQTPVFAAKIPAWHVMPHKASSARRDAASFRLQRCHFSKRSRVRQARLPARDDERSRDFCRRM